MTKLLHLPEGTGKVDVRIIINKIITSARKMQNLRYVHFVEKK